MEPLYIVLIVLLTAIVVGLMVYLLTKKSLPPPERVIVEKEVPSQPAAGTFIASAPPKEEPAIDARLLLKDENGFQREHLLNRFGNRMMVGREEDSDIYLKDSSVSRIHAKITKEEKEGKIVYSIVDLDSANGTKVNDQKIKGKTELTDGDIIQVGNKDQMRFVYTIVYPT